MRKEVSGFALQSKTSLVPHHRPRFRIRKPLKKIVAKRQLGLALQALTVVAAPFAISVVARSISFAAQLGVTSRVSSGTESEFLSTHFPVEIRMLGRSLAASPASPSRNSRIVRQILRDFT
jgi:hypothetical protein